MLRADPPPTATIFANGSLKNITVDCRLGTWLMAVYYRRNDDGHAEKTGVLLHGVVEVDYKRRFSNGDVIRTSLLLNKLGVGLYQTRNSVYLCEGQGHLLYLPEHTVDHITVAENEAMLKDLIAHFRATLSAQQPPEGLAEEALFSPQLFVPQPQLSDAIRKSRQIM